MLSNVFFLENLVVYEIMWKNMCTGQATDENMVREHCMLDM